MSVECRNQVRLRQSDPQHSQRPRTSKCGRPTHTMVRIAASRLAHCERLSLSLGTTKQGRNGGEGPMFGQEG